MIHPKDLTIYSVQLVPCTMKFVKVGFINPMSKFSVFEQGLSLIKITACNSKMETTLPMYFEQQFSGEISNVLWPLFNG